MAHKVMPLTARAEIVKNLQRAIAEIEKGMGDLSNAREIVRYQREALKLSHRCLSRLGGEA